MSLARLQGGERRGCGPPGLAEARSANLLGVPSRAESLPLHQAW